MVDGGVAAFFEVHFGIDFTGFPLRIWFLIGAEPAIVRLAQTSLFVHQRVIHCQFIIEILGVTFGIVAGRKCAYLFLLNLSLSFLIPPRRTHF